MTIRQDAVHRHLDPLSPCPVKGEIGISEGVTGDYLTSHESRPMMHTICRGRTGAGYAVNAWECEEDVGGVVPGMVKAYVFPESQLQRRPGWARL
jgi:hypothetical protein